MSEPELYEFSSPLTVVIDFKNPYAYLAVNPTCALIDELRIDAQWEPFNGPTLAHPERASASDDRATRHRWTRAQYRERELARYASVQGVKLGNIYRAPDSSTAGIGLIWVKRSAPEQLRAYLDLVFGRYWSETLDIEDAASIAALMDEIGVDSGGFERFHAGDAPGVYSKLQERLRAGGIFSAPTYVVDGDFFCGHQHLPMIRWLLSGRSGHPPI